MIDLSEKIKTIIRNETDTGHFSVLDDNSVGIIQQIFNGYEITNDLHQDFENIPKQAELLFVVAPTGAGKDSLVSKLKQKYPDKNYIELNIDIFRHYFTEFISDISTLNDRNFAKQTNEFSYEIYRTIQEILLSEFPGANIIITGTLRETDWVEDTLKRFKANTYTDYTIKMLALAVPYKISAISVVKRYVGTVVKNFQGKETTNYSDSEFIPGTIRYTSLSYHDDTYRMFPGNLGYFEKTENVNSIIDGFEVYERNGITYSSTNPIEGQADSAVQAVENLRLKQVDLLEEVDSSAINLLTLILEYQQYFKSQGIYDELVCDVGRVLLGYDKLQAMLAEKVLSKEKDTSHLEDDSDRRT